MKKSEIQEILASLYLRLNGYFVSGLIVHAPDGNRTQVDAIGVRLPYNSEPEREVNPSEYLQIPKGITDIVLCEVKGGHEPLQFNDAVRQDAAIRSVLRWIGAFEEDEVANLVQPVREMLTPRNPESPNTFRKLASKDGRYQLRLLLFAPDRPAPRGNQTRYVHGEELVGFISRCLRAQSVRSRCATQYDFGLWGALYEPIVRIIKIAHRDPMLGDIYAALADPGGV
jgi:hypothetical protein